MCQSQNPGEPWNLAALNGFPSLNESAELHSFRSHCIVPPPSLRYKVVTLSSVESHPELVDSYQMHPYPSGGGTRSAQA